MYDCKHYQQLWNPNWESLKDIICYKMVSKKETISYAFINLVENI